MVVVTIGAGEPAGGPASPFASPMFAGGAAGVVVVEGSEARGVVPGATVDEEVVVYGVPAGGFELEVVAADEAATDGTETAISKLVLYLIWKEPELTTRHICY